MQTRAPGMGRSCRYDRCEGTAILLTVSSSGTAVDLPPQRPFVFLLPPVAVVVYPRPPAGGPHGRSTASSQRPPIALLNRRLSLRGAWHLDTTAAP